jgi:hypothetical protein
VAWPGEQTLVESPGFVASYLQWWIAFGSRHHGRRARGRGHYQTSDLLLRAMAVEAVRVLGGWRDAARIMRQQMPEGRDAVRGIRLRE